MSSGYPRRTTRGVIVVNPVDAALATTLNIVVGRSRNLDAILILLGNSQLAKGVAVSSLFWWFWFRDGDAERVDRTREHLVSTLVGSIPAVVIARLLAIFLPFRVRPLFEPGLHLAQAKNAAVDLIDWSSFPSDHAVLFMVLVVGIAFVSRRAGVLAFVYLLVVIALPRLCLGYHYLSDVVAGILIGAAVGWWFNSVRVRQLISRPLLSWERRSASAFYAGAFVLSFEIATLFQSLRHAAVAFVHVAERILKS
jgi:undecaprenyl-diphosphatase